MKNRRGQHTKNKKRVLLTVVCCIAASVFLVLLPVMTLFVYRDNFGRRFETAEWMAYSVEDFDGLKVEECAFPSNDGQLLAGYRYFKDGQQRKGVLVIAHGFGGGGHNAYMDIADYFTSKGYLVFAYDATGCDKSEGDEVGGLPQGVIDLDYALRYVKQAEEYRNLPIVLFGHSWGGYCAGSVLNCHGDVRAAVLVAGFDCSTDLVEQWGESMAGPAIKLFMPYASLYERLKFGEYAAYSAMEGFAASDAGIMILQSRDDPVVLWENGYGKFHDVYGVYPRFCFGPYEGRGHSGVLFSEEAQEYQEQLDEKYSSYIEANGGEYTAEIKAEFMEKNLDKERCYEFDEELMGRIAEFYDGYCRKF